MNEMYVDTNQPTSSMNVLSLMNGENSTISEVNLTLTETELSNFLSGSDMENVTTNVNATNVMEFFPLNTTDSLLQVRYSDWF